MLKVSKLFVFIFCLASIIHLDVYAASKRELWIIMGPHQDIGAGWRKGMARYDNQIRKQVDLLLSDSRIKYSVGNVWNLAHFVRNNRGYREKIKNLMKTGSFSSSSGWTGFESTWFSGEYLQRNIFYSKKFLKSVLDYDSHWIQFNDVPSYTPQMPQILAKSDVKLMMIDNLRMYYVFNGIPYLNMVGLDGSKVFTSTVVYDELLDLLDFLPVDLIKKAIKNNTELLGTGIGQVIGDLGAEVEESKRVITFINEWNKNKKKAGMATLSIKTPEDFVDFALKKIKKSRVSLTSATGSCQPWPWKNYGNASAMSFFAKAENLLPTAEKLSSICEILGLGSYPLKSIQRGWENLLCFSDHNADNFLAYSQKAYNISNNIINEKLSKLGLSVRFSQDGIPVLLFNPLNWERKDVVLIEAVVPDGDFALVLNEKGEKIPSQIIGYDAKQKRIKLLVEVKVPSLGYTTYYISRGKPPNYGFSPFSIRDGHIENDYFSLDADNARGVFRIYDKKNKRNLLNVNKGSDFFAPEARMFHYEVLRKRGLKSVIKTVFLNNRIIESGPLRVVMKTSGNMEGCPVTMEWILYRNLDRLDIKTTVKVTHPLRKINTVINFPLKTSNNNIRIGVPYGSVPTLAGQVNRLTKFRLSKHSSKRSFFSYPYDEEFKNFIEGFGALSFQKWLSMEDNGACVVIAQPFYNTRFARRKKQGIIVGFPTAGKFKHYEYSFSIKTAKGNWKKANAFRLGWEKNNPIIYKLCERGKGRLPQTVSFLKLEPVRNLVLTTFKKTFDKGGYALRFFENMDEDVEAEISVPGILKLPFAEISRSNMLEEVQAVLSPESGEPLRLPVKAFGVETVVFFHKKRTDVIPPSRITDLGIVENGSVSVAFQWTAPGDDKYRGKAKRYEARFSNDSMDSTSWFDARSYGEIKEPAEAGSMEYVVFNGLDPNTEYFAAIKTFDERKNSSYISNIVEFVTEMSDKTPPGWIEDLSAKSMGSSSVSLAWTATGDDNDEGKVGNYRIYVSRKAFKEPRKIGNVEYITYKRPEAYVGEDEHFDVTGLEPDTGYYFCIVAFDEAGNFSLPSNVTFSGTRPFKSIKISSCEDTTISGVNEEEMAERYGDEKLLRTWDIRNRAVLIRFDLSVIPENIKIIKGYINIYNSEIVYAKRGRVTCYPISRKWDARFANWTHATKNVPWKTRGGDIDFNFSDSFDIDQEGKWVSLNITSVLKEWLSGKRKNYGLLLAGAPEREVHFYSSEYDDSDRRPFIEIKY